MLGCEKFLAKTAGMRYHATNLIDTPDGVWPEIVEVFLAHELASVEPDVAVAVAPLLWRQRRQDAVNDVQNLSSEILISVIHNYFIL